MVTGLVVENIAIIDRACVDLGSGLTVLTGETGAGKSILVEALGFALGDRADSSMVRSGAAKGTVSLTVTLPSKLAAIWGRELGSDPEDGAFVIQRDLSSQGRSAVRVNGILVSVSQLRQFGNAQVDLHGQHTHQSLLVQDNQLEFLDDWIGEVADRLKSRVGALFSDWNRVKARIESVKKSDRARAQRLDVLDFQIQEIQSIGPLIGEFESLKQSLERLKNSESLIQSARQGSQILGSTEGSVLENLVRVVRELETLGRHDNSLYNHFQTASDALYALQDAQRDLASFADALESDEGRLEATAQRLDSYHRLFKKYGEDEEAVIRFLAEALHERDDLMAADATLEDLLAECERLRGAYMSAATELSTLRRDKANQFEKNVEEHLRDLAMEKAIVSSEIEEAEPGPTGFDVLTFLMSANPGEPPKPLHKVASGGEISRVMLAIKAAGARSSGVPTLIFDEIDTGISGKAAAAMGQKLRDLSRDFQIIVISHLPQIASCADHHLLIEKTEQRGRVVTQIRVLSDDERVLEVARMLAGNQIGDAALANARELVAKSRASAL